MTDIEDTGTMAFRRTAPVWFWLRKNFSGPSLLTIAGIIGAAGGYIIHLQSRLDLLAQEVETLKEIVPTASSVASLAEGIADDRVRIARLEKNWDDAAQSAGTEPHPRSRHRGKL